MAGLLIGDYSRFLNGRVNEDAASLMRAAQLAGVKRYSNAMVAANLFNATLLVITLWPTKLRLTALCWALVLCCCLAGFVLSRWKKPSRKKIRRASARTMNQALRNACLLGSLWGAVPALMFTGAPPESQLIIVCLCAGMLGGGVIALARIPAAAVGMMLPIAIGSIVALSSMSAGSAAVAISLLAVFCAALIDAVFTQAFIEMARVASSYKVGRLAQRDSMTDLLNGAALRAQIDEAAARLAQVGEPSTLFVLKIDRMRDLNDQLGHGSGDEVLRQIAARLQASIRTIDCAARLGGSNFAVLANGIGGAATAEAYAGRLLAAFEAPFALPAGPTAISSCVGVAIFGPAAKNADDLLRNGNLALLAAKQHGAGSRHVYSPEDDIGRLSRDALEADLLKAIAKGELHLKFQPFLSLPTSDISGFEALLRWNHPVRGPVPPEVIVSIAEDRGLMDAIGVWVLKEACAAAANWPDHLRVAVNVSPAQLRSGALPAQVAQAVGDAGLSPGRLEIEITENVLIDDHPLAKHVLMQLKALGVELALDDFGIGYSSLNYLRRLPFDRLKIDRSFIAEALLDPDAASVVRAILRLAKDLRLEVTAEGVETPEQMHFLRDNGCEDAQGYIISEPMLEQEIGDFLAGWMLKEAA